MEIKVKVTSYNPTNHPLRLYNTRDNVVYVWGGSLCYGKKNIFFYKLITPYQSLSLFA